jgi:hypothetical protein
MKRRTWLACSIAFASLCAASFTPRAARACGGGDYGGDVTTFDPHVLDDASEEPLFYDPDTKAVGRGPCSSCAVDEMKADWAAFLGPGITDDDWSKILLSARLPDIDALILTLQGKNAKPPRGYEQNTVLKAAAGADREKIIAALYFVGFARRVEPYAAASPAWGEPRPKPTGDPAALQANGESAFGRAKLPFLRQRYAFQLLRLRFYRDDWKGVVSFHDKQRKALEGPSDNLKWRARYYVAGALNHHGELAKANLLLARIHSGSAALAPSAALDFQPMEETDWKETLALARSAKEKVELWRLVGLKLDAMEAARKIVALDPRSKRLALLVVRELNRAEYQDNAAALAEVETLAGRLADKPTTDRRWLFDLVAGHAAALSGDLKAARFRLQRVMKERPGTLAEGQAWASLALALAHAWKGPDKKAGEELAHAMAKVPGDFSRRLSVQQSVRQKLAEAYKAGGKCVEARLFGSDECAVQWSDPRFVEAMIARVSSTATAFDRFMVEESGYEPRGLYRELAMLHFAKGDLEAARKFIQQPKGVAASPLGTDPFVVHFRDCYDCDRKAFAGSKWTETNFIARLIELRTLAQRPGEAGAAAAFELGSGYYNITAFGNARYFTQGTHVAVDPAQAEAWYRRAYETSRNRELKAKAAFMAAKSELALDLATPPSSKRPLRPIDPADHLPIPTTWFPIVKSLADTAYHREVLRECGHYRRWAKRN